MPKSRADQILVAGGQVESRQQAQSLILAGKVWYGTERITKPGQQLPEDAELRVEMPPRFVSRGGEKLEGFLKEITLPIQPRNGHWLDVGASTGGFTDCLLQRGAQSVVCVDVGKCQLHEKLRQDPRVTNLEGINARHLIPGDLPRDAFDGIVVDVSFISLTRVLPSVWPFLRTDGWLISLIKPQFEVSREEASRGKGVIRDDEVRLGVLEKIRDFVGSHFPDAREGVWKDASIAGPKGNREFLMAWKKHPPRPEPEPQTPYQSDSPGS